MKRILSLFFIISFAFVSLQGQRINKPFVADTVKGNTVYFEYVNSSFNNPLDEYSGIIGFAFTKTDVADSLSVLQIQGSYDKTNYIDLTDATASLTETTTDGNYFLYEINSKFSSYRLKAVAETGDTVILSNVRFIYKEGK